MAEHHVYGPPGTGKSSYATRQIRRAAEAYGADRVMACSFTKAAAVELATKEVDGEKADIPRQMIGTLHSLCYRALENPPLAEAHIGDFNDLHPEYLLTGAAKPDVDDLGSNAEADASGTAADGLRGQYDLLRARCADREAWPVAVQGFAKAWESWKDANGAFDYTDLIEHAPAAPPGNPKVLFCDEAQDFNRLQYRLIRKWTASTDMTVMLADDDQCVYSFTGASPGDLIDADVPAGNRIVLKQSYRLPAAVHRYASAWIQQVEHRQRKEFLPRDHPGEVRAVDASLRFLDTEMGRIAALAEAPGEPGVPPVMIVATCGYMLRGAIAQLREAGLAFHNPWRPGRGDWNPLSKREGGASQRVSSFLAHEGGKPWWTMYNLAQWVPLLKAEGILRRGAKAEIERIAEEQPGYRPSLREIGERWIMTEALSIVSRETFPSAEAVRWFAANCLEPKRKPVAYACEIARKALARGGDARQALAIGPRIVVGTAHSLKGSEASHVWLAPDLSPQSAEQWHRSVAGRDEIRRVFYVGMTRARESLTLLKPMGRLSVRLT